MYIGLEAFDGKVRTHSLFGHIPLNLPFRCLDMWLLSHVLHIFHISHKHHIRVHLEPAKQFFLHLMAAATASASSGLNGLTARDGETQNN